MYFVSSNGKPCDVGSCKLAESNKIRLNRNLEYLSVNVDKRNNGTPFSFMHSRGKCIIFI